MGTCTTCCKAFCKHGNVFLSMQNLARLAEQRFQGIETEVKMAECNAVQDMDIVAAEC